MKLLLDENVDRRIKPHFKEHEVYTVQEKGWAGIKNGPLLRLMVEDGVEVFVTADKNLQHQQNFQKQNIAVILLSVKSLSLESFLPLIPKLKKVLKQELQPGVTIIE